MSSVAHLTIHASQFPAKVRCDLLESLRMRRVNHKFHYDSLKQTQQWLALHQVYSPSRTDGDCAQTYDQSFEAAAARIQKKRVHLIGLGCGGGQKDARLLRLLRDRGKEVCYTPCDVSTAMVLAARQTALAVIPGDHCFPLVCDLATAEDLLALFDSPGTRDAVRLITFFGMISNFEPELTLPKLASLVRSDDLLLFSANLAPGSNYAVGVQRILPQYDNPLTREWLLTFLLDLGVERDDGELRFTVEDGQAGLKRVVAQFHFLQAREIRIEDERFKFCVDESMRLFFSYRYTPALVRLQLAGHGLEVRDEWMTKSEEEGVFLVSRR